MGNGGRSQLCSDFCGVPIASRGGVASEHNTHKEPVIKKTGPVFSSQYSTSKLQEFASGPVEVYGVNDHSE